MASIPPTVSYVMAVLDMLATSIAAYIAWLSYKGYKYGFPRMRTTLVSFSALSLSFTASAYVSLLLSSPPRGPPTSWMPHLLRNPLFIAVQFGYAVSYLTLLLGFRRGEVDYLFLVPTLPFIVAIAVYLASRERASPKAQVTYLGLALSHLITTLAFLTYKPWLLIVGELVRSLSLIPIAILLGEAWHEA